MGVQRWAVLVVEADPAERRSMGAWLEEAGFDVVLCPGPSGPEYTCVGSREGVCPLVAQADVVVIDMSLESEIVMQGTAAEELLDLYLTTGRHVITLGSHGGPDPFAEDVVVRLSRHPGRDDLMQAVRTALGRGVRLGPPAREVTDLRP